MRDRPYDQAWSRFRGAVRLLRFAEALWLAPIAVFVVGIVAFELVPNSLDWRGPLWWSFLGLLAVALGVRALAERRMRRFPCPRCGQPFLRLSLLQRAPLAEIERRFPCQHCKLPVGAV
jgi:hypothetical protein